MVVWASNANLLMWAMVWDETSARGSSVEKIIFLEGNLDRASLIIVVSSDIRSSTVCVISRSFVPVCMTMGWGESVISFFIKARAFSIFGQRKYRPLSKRVETWGESRGAFNHGIVLGAHARLFLTSFAPPNDPIIERTPTLAPGLHSFWKWAIARRTRMETSFSCLKIYRSSHIGRLLCWWCTITSWSRM